jgi:hypothetical protein
MWIRFFLSTGLATARQLFREHLSVHFATPELIARVRECLPSDRARLLYDLLVVELALEWQLQIDTAYIERTRDVSPLVLEKDADNAR